MIASELSGATGFSVFPVVDQQQQQRTGSAAGGHHANGIIAPCATWSDADLRDVAAYGLRPVTLDDRAVIDGYFRTLRRPLSDYTFSQLFSWRNSLRILWRELDGHLCVFANGTGDLTLLLPPVGDTGSDRALARCFEVMDDYNVNHRVPDRSRVEYASEEMLARFDGSRFDAQPMGADYLYDVNRMIDLAGGDLASKRQAKNRFLRNHQSRVEVYEKSKHFAECCALLDSWKAHQDANHAEDAAATSGALKRQKESLATKLTLEFAGELGLKGMVVYVTNPADGSQAIRGFTFGEYLGADQSSIVIEKTDLEAKGLAQFIFSEFCRTAWADRPLVNAGDDWGLESLAWTKSSYRPVEMLKKFVLAKKAGAMSGPGYRVPGIGEASTPAPAPAPQPDTRHPTPDTRLLIRRAKKDDLTAALALESGCFDAYNLGKRQLAYHQAKPSSVFLVAELDGRVVGEGIALVRHHKNGVSGRLYSLAVDPAARGQKIGRKLMRAMLDELAARGVRRAYLEVEQTNDAAVKLYESMGFTRIGALADYYGEGRGGWHMAIDIAAQETTVAAAG